MRAMLHDRRKVVRYAVRIPIDIAEIGSGSTTDISASGIAFLTDFALEPGSQIRFHLRMEDSFLFRCHGRVIRVEDRGSQSFCAVMIDETVVEQGEEHRSSGEENSPWQCAV